MRILLVYTHPVAESFTAAVRDVALAGLAEGGHEVRVTDLYAENFNPVMSRQDRLEYHNMEINTRHVADHVANLRWAEGLVFVFPTWNSGLPAMLKGWFDRVWVQGVGFVLKTGGVRQFVPTLTNIRLMVALSTGGAPRFLTWLSGHPVRRMLMRGMRTQCHPRCKTIWMALYRIDSSTQEMRAAHLARVRARMARI
ncbi:MAG TPA: NAD(P)H-dependent oxidoreductase [Magnetospirillaceae bacterium]|jgi:putative NADPH-quinone reductase